MYTEFISDVFGLDVAMFEIPLKYECDHRNVV